MLRLDALAPSPTGTVLHIVREFRWPGHSGRESEEFSPLCRWSTWWPIADWATNVVRVATDTDLDGATVCRLCMRSARWRIDMLVEEFEILSILSGS